MQEYETKVRALATRTELISEQRAELDGALQLVFKSLFVHRYRDVSPDIRLDVLSAFGTWIVAAPIDFLTNAHLKYVGWMLNDRESPRLRRAALSVLLAIFTAFPDVDTRAKMADFFTRFRARIAEMAHDVDEEVRVTALAALRQAWAADFLTMAEVEQVRAALLAPSLRVRRAAAAFLLHQLPAFTEPAPDTSSASGM